MGKRVDLSKTDMAEIYARMSVVGRNGGHVDGPSYPAPVGRSQSAYERDPKARIVGQAKNGGFVVVSLAPNKFAPNI